MTVYRCVAVGATPQGEVWNTGLHLEKIGGTISDAMAAWKAAFELLWLGIATPADSIKQLISTDTTCTETIVNSLTPDFHHNVEQKRESEILAGTSAAENLPPDVSAVLTVRDGAPTKAGRGRMYLPPMTVDAEITTGRIDATSREQIANAGAGMLASLIASTYQPVILHRNLLVTTNIISTDVGDVFGHQSRRKDKLVPVRTIIIL